MTYTIVGVIGHIDHGKTSLVAALTGVDTDTHPEEQRRGITIDLGFASFTQDDLTFALVDAPGHQKYIGNLLAGVSSIDIGLLVVAADQGIQAQTLEHASIVSALGVDQLVAVISRVDLADNETVATLSEELEVFLADFGFHDVPTVAVSTVSGQGLDEVRALLTAHARRKQRAASGHFRMPIDRAFTIEGRGTVVAGTPWSGTVTVGDHLQIARTGQVIRVREIETHGSPKNQSHPGVRTAMNIVGATSNPVRGDELVSTGTHRAVSRLIARLTMFRDAPDLRTPRTVQFHTATTACAARLLGPKQIKGGESTILVVDTDSPVVATFGQSCLLRLPYPVGSFAGASVLGTVTTAMGKTSDLRQLGAQLLGASAADRIAAWVEYQGELIVAQDDLDLRMGIQPADQSAAIASLLESNRVMGPIPGLLVSRRRIDDLIRRIEKILTRQAESTDQAWLDEESLVKRIATKGSGDLVRWVIHQLVESQRLTKVRKLVAIASEQTVLSKKQRSRLDKILETYRDAKTPPTVKEVAQQLEITMDAVESLARFATSQRTLVDLGSGFLMARDAFVSICAELDELFAINPNPTVADIRDHLGITRKHAIPLLEYCDAIGVTVRHGDRRARGGQLDSVLAESKREHG